MVSKLIKFITVDEFGKLRKACKDKSTRLALDLGFGSGLRISEIVGYERKDGSRVHALTKDNVDLQAHQIRVVSGKGNKDRITCTPPSMNVNDLSLLPITVDRRTLQNRIKALGKKVLGKDISPHTLRHGFGNFMVNEQNVPLPLVQQMLGHSRLDTTGIYTKANPKTAISAAMKAWGIEE